MSYKLRDNDVRSWRGGIKGYVEETARLIKTTKSGYQLVLTPFLFGSFLAVGISLALVYSAQAQAMIAAVRIDETANDVATLFVSTVRSAVIPVYVGRALALANQKNFSAILPQYSVIAQDALDASQGACAVIGVAPNGRVVVQYPLKGNEKSIGHDLFRISIQTGVYQGATFTYMNRHADSLKVVAQRDVYVTDPAQLTQGYKGMFARLAVFVKGVNRNETFGQQVGISDCDAECYDSTKREKVWGIITGILRWDNIVPVFTQKLASYRFSVSSGSTVILQSADPVTGKQYDGIAAKDISVFNLRWRLTVEPKASTLIPEWRDPVIAVTCFAAVVVSLMVQLILVQKKQRRRLLLDILPKYALTALESGLDPSRDFDCACILFTDIVNFTQLCSANSPHDISVLLHELYTLFDRLADAHSVFKIETIGDAFVCCTGCPYPGNSREKDAERLALFAIDLINSVSSFQSSNGINIEIRVGLHCGPVVGTIMGRKCPRFCLVGDAVNVSSRMESTSEPMRIHCSSAIAKLLRQSSSNDALHLDHRGVINVKGKGQMETYWLRARDDDDDDDAFKVSLADADADADGGAGADAKCPL